MQVILRGLPENYIPAKRCRSKTVRTRQLLRQKLYSGYELPEKLSIESRIFEYKAPPEEHFPRDRLFIIFLVCFCLLYSRFLFGA